MKTPEEFLTECEDFMGQFDPAESQAIDQRRLRITVKIIRRMLQGEDTDCVYRWQLREIAEKIINGQGRR
jgi:hypothetical protein